MFSYYYKPPLAGCNDIARSFWSPLPPLSLPPPPFAPPQQGSMSIFEMLQWSMRCTQPNLTTRSTTRIVCRHLLSTPPPTLPPPFPSPQQGSMSNFQRAAVVHGVYTAKFDDNKYDKDRLLACVVHTPPLPSPAAGVDGRIVLQWSMGCTPPNLMTRNTTRTVCRHVSSLSDPSAPFRYGPPQPPPPLP